MSYDQWKADIPEYYGFEDPPECEHDDADFDILDGRLRCHCGYSRHLSAEEIDSELRRMSEYDALMAREARRLFWRDITLPARKLLGRLFGSNLPKPILADDEIPF